MSSAIMCGATSLIFADQGLPYFSPDPPHFWQLGRIFPKPPDDARPPLLAVSAGSLTGEVAVMWAQIWHGR